jgi:hypothetical protein
MNELSEDGYKIDELFSESQENLLQIPARFKSSTLSEIERISRMQDTSKAQVIRKLVDVGLEEVEYQ